MLKLAISAGGTGGHIFPALATALHIKKQYPQVALLWVGTHRSREQELCLQYDIPIIMLVARGFRRAFSLSALVQAAVALGLFIGQIFIMFKRLRAEKVNAVLSFGGYVSAPVLAVALLRRIPYYCHEQNTVPGMVTRLFSAGARTTFLSFPLSASWRVRGTSKQTGIPVRQIDEAALANFRYPAPILRDKATILITGGSQSALAMNRCLLEPVIAWANSGLQIIWQTGKTSFHEISPNFTGIASVVLFENIADLYPYYALSKIVVCRAGASTLGEVALFGLPCICIPLPWSAENHQWFNAGAAEEQDWSIRVRQDDTCGRRVRDAVTEIIADSQRYAAMSQCARRHAPLTAASMIAQEIIEGMGS